MRLRLQCSQLSTCLMRSAVLTKVVVSCFFVLAISAIWWISFYQKILYKKHETVVLVGELERKKDLFDEALSEYKKLSLVNKSSNDKSGLVATDTPESCYRQIIDQARISGLDLSSFAKKTVKSKFKQMVFVFYGDYKSLLSFLKKIDHIGMNIGCNKLKISENDYRLQITYVCGIHTSMKT